MKRYVISTVLGVLLCIALLLSTGSAYEAKGQTSDVTINTTNFPDDTRTRAIQSGRTGQARLLQA